jgi:hypothetical protein
MRGGTPMTAPKLMRARPEAQPELLDRLQLSSDQRVRVDSDPGAAPQEMEQFWNQHRPTLRAIADSARAEMRGVLTPEQRSIEESFMAERRKHMGRSEAKRREAW